jgi:hypothetical protein
MRQPDPVCPICRQAVPVAVPVIFGGARWRPSPWPRGCGRRPTVRYKPPDCGPARVFAAHSVCHRVVLASAPSRALKGKTPWHVRSAAA